MQKSTNLFKQRFKYYLEESIRRCKNLKPKKKIKQEDENTVGGGALGPAAAIGQAQSGDWYAPGDYRVPKALGAIQTRRGPIGGKRKRKKKNKSKKKT